ncbi:MAG: hypothetical protein K2F91_01005 [Muribaculaceae bacterium]|nr:hypothetical protein [Muribaculaceae bacterium]MDE6196427.1 hypothetical protein [Muribaculaceae bacterium]
MKKIIILLMAICLMIPAVSAAGNKQLEKAHKKEMKNKMKEFKKEGWKLFGSTRTLEVALLTHYDKLNNLGDDGYEVAGVATNFKSKNVGKQMASNSACVTYAQMAGSTLKGRVVSDMSANGSAGAEEEFEHFYAAYERLVEKEIKNEMSESFSVIKDNPDGTHELQTFYIVSESAASKARQRALENAIKESALAQSHASKISEFVNQGLDR